MRFRFKNNSSGKENNSNSNRKLTRDQKQARAEAQNLADKTAEAASLIAAENAQKMRDKSSKATSESRIKVAKKLKAERAERNSTGKFIRDVISGNFLTGDGITAHIPYLLFLSGLFLMHINLGYKFENLERDKMKTERALEEVVAEYKTLRSDLESRLQQSRVESATAALGLEQPIEPPILLKVDDK